MVATPPTPRRRRPKSPVRSLLRSPRTTRVGGSGWFGGSDSGEDSKSGANSESESQKKSESTPEPQKEFYANCKAAKAAGAAPLYRGDPGYSEDLDRDGDGIACEK